MRLASRWSSTTDRRHKRTTSYVYVTASHHQGRVQQLTGRIGPGPDHWDGLMLDRSAVGQLSFLSSRTKWQRLPAGDTLRSLSPACNRFHFVLLDKDESCPTADLSKRGRPNGPAYSTGELLNTPQIITVWQRVTLKLILSRVCRSAMSMYSQL